MRERLVPPVLLLLIMVFSCADEDEQNELTYEQDTQRVTLNLDSNFQSCDSVFIATYHGTACCISGPTVTRPGKTFQYHYQMNHRDPQISWQILEGDISIIAGQDTQTVTVKFGPSFTTGIIIGVGNGIKYDDSPRLKCSDRVIVSRQPG